MILDIVKYPNKFLAKESKVIDNMGYGEKKDLKNMLDTMRANKGIGIAAVQVGILKQLIIVDIGKGNLIKLGNPKILIKKGEISIAECCLSVPNESVKIQRANEVLVSGLNENNQEEIKLFHGLEAIAVQHEIDHLNGKIIIDYKV
ncbi:MAG: peptide deformylase [bacterium]|nr:peptide deformylase [bacterium]